LPKIAKLAKQGKGDFPIPKNISRQNQDLLKKYKISSDIGTQSALELDRKCSTQLAVAELSSRPRPKHCPRASCGERNDSPNIAP
jgi:hypothetical protein